jgi:hypothetical protein
MRLRAARAKTQFRKLFMKNQNQVRKNSKPSSAPKQAEIKYWGKSILRNYWVKIGFSPAELKALQTISRYFDHKEHRTTGRAAAFVLTTALMNWDKLEPLAIASQKHAREEGFGHHEYFNEEIIASKFKLNKAVAS